MNRPRILIIGAGMAGASLAFELSADADVVVLEMEAMPGQHATGRSAALFSETYGGPIIRKLSRASRPFLLGPPAGFATHPLLCPRGVMYVASPEQRAGFAQMRGLADVAPQVREISIEEALQRVPILRRDRLEHALLEANAMDIDVHGLHQGYLRAVRAAGGRIVCQAGISAIERSAIGWRVVTPAQVYIADVIVNAAGAWGDDVARLAGVEPLGLVDRFESVTTANVRRVNRAWAGLRTFVSDRVPVAGYSEDSPSFFWLIGQGGYGIQTAPALARLAASVLLERPPQGDLMESGIDVGALQPARLRRA